MQGLCFGVFILLAAAAPGQGTVLTEQTVYTSVDYTAVWKRLQLLFVDGYVFTLIGEQDHPPTISRCTPGGSCVEKYINGISHTPETADPWINTQVHLNDYGYPSFWVQESWNSDHILIIYYFTDSDSVATLGTGTTGTDQTGFAVSATTVFPSELRVIYLDGVSASPSIRFKAFHTETLATNPWSASVSGSSNMEFAIDNTDAHTTALQLDKDTGRAFVYGCLPNDCSSGYTNNTIEPPEAGFTANRVSVVASTKDDRVYLLIPYTNTTHAYVDLYICTDYTCSTRQTVRVSSGETYTSQAVLGIAHGMFPYVFYITYNDTTAEYVVNFDECLDGDCTLIHNTGLFTALCLDPTFVVPIGITKTDTNGTVYLSFTGCFSTSVKMYSVSSQIASPTSFPTMSPTGHPTFSTTQPPTPSPTNTPTRVPTNHPTPLIQTGVPTLAPTNIDGEQPRKSPSETRSLFWGLAVVGFVMSIVVILVFIKFRGNRVAKYSAVTQEE